MYIPFEEIFAALELNSREYALLTWIIIFSFLGLLILLKQDQLSSLTDVLKSIFKFKMLTPLILYFGWFIICICLLIMIDFWHLHFLKMTILWFVAEGFLILFNTILAKDSEQVKSLLINYLKQALSVSTIIILTLNLHTLNYFFELGLTFILIVIGILIGFLRAQDAKNHAVILNSSYFITSSITVILLLYTFISLFINFDYSNLTLLINEYFMMIIFTVWMLPIVYLFKLFATYEVIWINLNRFKYLTERIKKRILLSVFINCHLNLRKLEFFRYDYNWKSTKFDSNGEIKKYFKEFNISYSDDVKMSSTDNSIKNEKKNDDKI